jgi:SAM-dependent methyltransferase
LNGIPRLLLSPLREAMLGHGSNARKVDTRQAQTARSFGFEWSHFPEMYDEWERNFFDYMSPYGPGFFRGKRVLDAGCGSGRHAYYAAQNGAEVWAIDLGPAVEVARRNTADCDAVHVVQADLHRPPFAPESFDFIYSIGVLHHLPDPEAAFRRLLQFLKPGGDIHIYLYWKPEEQPLKSALLAAVTMLRHLTVRLPHWLLYALSYPAAWAAFAFFVWPYKLLRHIPRLRRLAEKIPMKQYAQYPFRVCVNDQFDRFSAPIENRYTKVEVEGWLKRAGLEDVSVRANYGWVGSGRKPASVAERTFAVAEAKQPG